MKKTILKQLLITMLVLMSISMIPWGAVHAQDPSGLSLKLYGSDPDNTQNVYALETDPRDPTKNYIIPLLLVLKNISGQRINAERGFSQVELHRALKVTDPCGTPLELPPDAGAYAFDAGMPRFVGGRALIPAEILAVDFARSLTIDDLRDLFPVMYELPGEYTVSAQLKGARFFLTEFDEAHGLQGVANHRSNWFGAIDAKVGLEEKPQLTLVILPVRGGHLKFKLEKEEAQTIQPLFGIPVKAFVGNITEDPANVWAATEVEPVLTGTTEINGEVKWECNKCLPQGTYTILAKYQDDFQKIEVTESDSSWGEKCSGLISKVLAFGEENPTVVDDHVTVAYSGVRYDRRTRLFSTLATLTNTSMINFNGPVWLVIKGLKPDEASLTNAEGQIDGHFYIEALSSDSLWEAGTTISNIELLFANPTRIRITFDEEVRAITP